MTPTGSPIIKLVVYHPVPSLNRLFNMNRWQRQKEKRITQAALLLALCPTEQGFSTQTTFVQSILSTAYGTLDSYMMTEHKTLTSKYRNRKSKHVKKNGRK